MTDDRYIFKSLRRSGDGKHLKLSQSNNTVFNSPVVVWTDLSLGALSKVEIWWGQYCVSIMQIYPTIMKTRHEPEYVVVSNWHSPAWKPALWSVNGETTEMCQSWLRIPPSGSALSTRTPFRTQEALHRNIRQESTVHGAVLCWLVERNVQQAHVLRPSPYSLLLDQ